MCVPLVFVLALTLGSGCSDRDKPTEQAETAAVQQASQSSSIVMVNQLGYPR